jgi:hypothetical protein
MIMLLNSNCCNGPGPDVCPVQARDVRQEQANYKTARPAGSVYLRRIVLTPFLPVSFWLIVRGLVRLNQISL